MGLYVAFEGLNGCGKSTLSKMLADYLISKDREVCYTKEPGATQFGQSLRQTMLHGDLNLTQETMFLLMSADRKEHMNKVVLPALESGKDVVQDRGKMSSLVFQQKSDFGIAEILHVSEIVTDAVEPIWIYVKCHNDTISQRLGKTEDQDNFEKEQQAQLDEYRRRYEKATEILGAYTVDNNGTLESSFEQVLAILDMS